MNKKITAPIQLFNITNKYEYSTPNTDITVPAKREPIILELLNPINWEARAFKIDFEPTIEKTIELPVGIRTDCKTPLNIAARAKCHNSNWL